LRIESGKWKVESGKWRIESGKWAGGYIVSYVLRN
jgi:hypothetical protein